MPTSFGAQTDYFGLADADWELQSSRLTPSHSSAQAADQHNDVVAEHEHEKTEECENVYRLVGNGALGVIGLPEDFKGGEIVEVGAIRRMITGGSLATSNTERPLLTVTGRKMHGNEDAVAIYDFAAAIGDILARKVATAIGFTVNSGTYLNSCSVTCSMETAAALDSDGEIAIVDNSKARIEATGELVNPTGAPAATVAANWTKPSDVEKGESNTAFADGSVMVYRNIQPDA